MLIGRLMIAVELVVSVDGLRGARAGRRMRMFRVDVV